jgi:hypothetical protein
MSFFIGLKMNKKELNIKLQESEIDLICFALKKCATQIEQVIKNTDNEDSKKIFEQDLNNIITITNKIKNQFNSKEINNKSSTITIEHLKWFKKSFLCAKADFERFETKLKSTINYINNELKTVK